MSAVIGAESATQLIFVVMRKGGNRMAELKPFEVIMKIDFGANDGVTAVAHAEKVAKLVRCKDCKHRPMLENPVGKQYGFNVIAPEDEHGWEDNTCPYLVDDGFYSRYPSDNFFCAYGERIE